jgi:hypothetical protein
MNAEALRKAGKGAFAPCHRVEGGRDVRMGGGRGGVPRAVSREAAKAAFSRLAQSLGIHAFRLYTSSFRSLFAQGRLLSKRTQANVPPRTDFSTGMLASWLTSLPSFEPTPWATLAATSG